MKVLFHYNRQLILLIFIISFAFNSYSQNYFLPETKVLDSIIALNNYTEADSILTIQIENFKQKKAYFDLTQFIYFVGKITLKLEGESVAVEKVNTFANSITNTTDDLDVTRQKHLVLSRFYVLIKDYKKSTEQNLLALEVTKMMPKPTGNLFGIIHHNLSIDYRRQGDIKNATLHSHKSLEYYLSYPKSDKTKILDAYNSLGGRMWDVYKIDSALFYFKKGEKIINELEQTPMNTYFHKAKIQSNISSIYSLLGKSSEASNYNEKAIRNYSSFIKSNTNGEDFFKEEARLFLLMTIENYADDFSNQGNYTKAKDLIEYVYEQKLKFMPSDKSEIAYTSLQLGNIYLKLKDYKLAEEFFNKGLEIYTKSNQKNYLGIADAYYYKGIINEYYNNVDVTKYCYEKSKGYYDNIFDGSYDKFYLNAMLTYSSFYSKNGYTDKAIEMATRAYNYIIKNQGQETDLESSQLLNLADIYYNSEKYTEASKHINKALYILNSINDENNNQLNVLTTSFKKPMVLLLKTKIALQLSDQKDSTFLKKQYSNLKEAISILEKQKTIVTEDQNVSIILEDNDEVFEFAKQIALMLYKKTKKTKYLKELLSLHESKLYNKIRQQLNVQTNFSSKDIPSSILEQEKRLKKELNSALNNENGLETFIKTNENWTGFLNILKHDYPKYYALRYASITKSLNNLSANFNKDRSVIRYIFINEELYVIVLEKNKTEVYNLDSSKLKKALITKEENSLESSYALYTILWQPFEKIISNKDIIIVPDGELFNLSFEVLTSAKVNSYKELVEKSLLNKYNISYNYSLLLINKNKTPKFFKNNFVAFTPEFNEEMKNKYKVAIEDSVLLDKTYLRLLPQPFTVDLAKEYSKLFDGSSFTNEKASKQIFTQNAKEHKIIHIGTHAESNNISPELSRLIFAKNVNDTISSEDNSLYTYEIYNQNLSSNLAILTACETGKPTYQAGEGMISLAHAFNYAGSESILTSLWKIDEQSSATIIENFYGYLKKGLPKDEALRKAKLDYIGTAEGRTISPQYWAGLVLIGDSSPIDLKTSSNLPYWSLGILLIIVLAILIRRKNDK